GDRPPPGRSGADQEGRGYHASPAQFWLGRGVCRHLLFHGRSVAYSAAAGVDEEALVGAPGKPHRYVQELSVNGKPRMPGVVPQSTRVQLGALLRSRSRRMVRLSEPAGRALYNPERQQVERLFPRSTRDV